jgi:hypothetical protein
MGDHPLSERLAVFREMAAEARADASRASNPEMKAGYEQLAESWDLLIGEIEAAMKKPDKR